jgi:hypothetical protein
MMMTTISPVHEVMSQLNTSIIFYKTNYLQIRSPILVEYEQ